MLGGLKSMTGQLEFFSADDFEVLNAAEHFMCTDVEWDPTGRYVATAVNHMHQMENGFKVWLFNGQLLYQCAPPALPSLCLFLAGAQVLRRKGAMAEVGCLLSLSSRLGSA